MAASLPERFAGPDVTATTAGSPARNATGSQPEDFVQPGEFSQPGEVFQPGKFLSQKSSPCQTS